MYVTNNGVTYYPLYRIFCWNFSYLEGKNKDLLKFPNINRVFSEKDTKTGTFWILEVRGGIEESEIEVLRIDKCDYAVVQVGMNLVTDIRYWGHLNLICDILQKKNTIF